MPEPARPQDVFTRYQELKDYFEEEGLSNDTIAMMAGLLGIEQTLDNIEDTLINLLGEES